MDKHNSEGSYQPIENYGVIGDLNTVALVGLNGSIDFMCFPDFDSPSIFAALLDRQKGGCFQITPAIDDLKFKQLYLPDTNILLSRFLSSEGVGEITDFMPVAEINKGHTLIRRVTAVRGDIKFFMKCKPRFNYAQNKHRTEVKSKRELLFISEGTHNLTIRLISTVDMYEKDGDAFSEFTLGKNARADFIFELLDDTPTSSDNLENNVTSLFEKTMNYWKGWISNISYHGRWVEVVSRSALILKLMTSQKYGSIVASPTFSLPEFIGGERNWDYRYTWIRDSSFTVYVLLKLGFKTEAEAFMKWVEKECEEIGEKGNLHLMYTIAGERELDETILSHLEGYKKSAPVRIGNNAHSQIQLDIYGELMDAVYLYNKNVSPISYAFWKNLVRQVDWVTENWDLKDEGIWEVRGGKRDFLYSKMMCWVAIDRAIKIAAGRSFPISSKWILTRNKIFDTIYRDYWNNDRKTFIQYKGVNNVDAALLLMPLMRFIAPKDPMWLSTLKAIEEDLVSDSLVFRYRHEEAAYDGLNSAEGTFSMCTFWYIEALAKSGQLQKAQLFFEKMLGYANHVGIYAEQLGFQGEHLGNYPQGFTHLGLVSTAITLNHLLNRERKIPIKEEFKG